MDAPQAVALDGELAGHPEDHRSTRSGWLRATVLGANDGLLSTGALLLGVVAAGGDSTMVLTSGIAGLAAGAGSMALGEYVSVSSQRDAERADALVEAQHLAEFPEGELAELRDIYVERGLRPELAEEVAEQLMAKDPLEAHLRDELGITDERRARPVQAALSSFVAFSVGAAVPIGVAAVSSDSTRGVALVVATLCSLASLGALAAWLGGASVLRGAARVMIGGALGLAVTYAVGSLLDVAIG